MRVNLRNLMAVENNTLKATVRAAGSKGAARAVRRAGLVPAVAYGHGIQDLVVAVEPADLETVLRTDYGFNAVFNLEVEGKGTHKVMVRDVQIDSVKRVVTHIDFKIVTDDEKLIVDVPVLTSGRSKGVQKGGRLETVRRVVKLKTTVAAIPTDVTHDVTALDIGGQVYIDEMEAPEGTTFLFNHRFPVLRVVRRRGAKEEAADEAEDAAAAAGGDAPAEEPAADE